MKVAVLVISHSHGENVTVHGTEESVYDELHKYVKENWKRWMPEIPENKHDAIHEYFIGLEEHYDWDWQEVK